ncbi:MAG: hypothetical protein GY932_06935 [Arcobacter sp.]|nr:hypothetical protein [Arcobacter sp.]
MKIIMKWLFFIFLALILLSLIIYFSKENHSDSYFGIKNEATNILFGKSKNIKYTEKIIKKSGARKMNNEWKEFNFDNLEGESRYISKLAEKGKSFPAFEKYSIGQIKIYNDVSFVLGSDLNQAQQVVDILDAEKHEIAYLFISKDNGKTFKKQTFGHGSAQIIKRIKNTLFLDILENDTDKRKSFKSKDLGATWIEISPKYLTPKYLLNEDKYIHNINGGNKMFITNNGGESWNNVSSELQKYFDNSNKIELPIVYKDNTMVVYKNKKLIFFNIDNNKSEIKDISIPGGKIGENLKLDVESNELYLSIYDDINNPRLSQPSILYPLKNELVVLDKELQEIVYLKVANKYIGGLIKIKGVLVHIWTLNKGKNWNYEVLKHYFWNTAVGYGNEQIYLVTAVRKKEGIENGRYLAIGKIKN